MLIINNLGLLNINSKSGLTRTHTEALMYSITSSSAVAENPRDALYHDKRQNFRTVT